MSTTVLCGNGILGDIEDPFAIGELRNYESKIYLPMRTFSPPSKPDLHQAVTGPQSFTGTESSVPEVGS